MSDHYIIMVKSEGKWRQHAKQKIYYSLEEAKAAAIHWKKTCGDFPDDYKIGWAPVEIHIGGIVIV